MIGIILLSIGLFIFLAGTIYTNIFIPKDHKKAGNIITLLSLILVAFFLCAVYGCILSMSIGNVGYLIVGAVMMITLFIVVLWKNKI